jgi:hypothetical protein
MITQDYYAEEFEAHVMSTHDKYSERYREEFVEITTSRERQIKREQEERENKFKEVVRKLYERIRLK